MSGNNYDLELTANKELNSMNIKYVDLIRKADYMAYEVAQIRTKLSHVSSYLYGSFLFLLVFAILSFTDEAAANPFIALIAGFFVVVFFREQNDLQDKLKWKESDLKSVVSTLDEEKEKLLMSIKEYE